jgi:threonine/homoserine/homoserine lactone efflux protein
VSFLGSLPIGALNLTAMDVAVRHRYYQVFLFSLGAIIVEYWQAYFAIRFSDFLMDRPAIERVIEIGVIPIFLIIGAAYLYSPFYQKKKKAADAKGKVAAKRQAVPPFSKGLLLSLANPLAIPYWLVYSTSLKAAGLLRFDWQYIQAFVFGIVVGTFVALAMYGALGELLTKKIERYKHWFNPIIGMVFIILAIVQIYRWGTGIL